MLRIKTKMGHITKYAEYTKYDRTLQTVLHKKMDNLDKYIRSHSV